MKTIAISIVYLFLPFLLMANRPERIPQKVYPLTRQYHELDFYITQAAIWKDHLQHHPKDANAWLNYYTAERSKMLKNGSIRQAELDQIVQKISTQIPESFESHYIKYINSPISTKNIADLEMAYQLAPQRYETFPEFILHYHKKGNLSKVREFCNKWIVSGEYSTGLLNWNYNMIAPLDKNAILITSGDNTTFPIWLLQQSRGIRSDVSVLNLELLKDKTYLSTFFNQIGVTAPDIQYQGSESIETYQQLILEHLINKTTDRSLYFSVGLDQEVLKKHSNQLYLIGLALKYSKEAIDHTATLKYNYEQVLLKDYLLQNFYHDISQSVVDRYNLNYLPAFLVLQKHYTSAKETQKLAYLEKLILKIADAAGKGKAIRSYLKLEENTIDFETSVSISYKSIEAMFTKNPMNINGGLKLHPAISETSNEQYELFLTDLLKQKQYEKIQLCQIHPTDWRSYLPENCADAKDEVIYKFAHPGDPETAVQNISYEAASLYCQWLTHLYNNLDHKKKRYKKVLFRLPTEEEWVNVVSKDAPQNAIYPWSGIESINKEHQATNKKGCFLANFNVHSSDAISGGDCTEDEDAAKDGLLFPGHINSYFPTDHGLYNSIGNVAEMLMEKGKAKGGSWYHSPKESTIQAVNSYEQPQPYIGFRVFMEVIEE